jgi:tRNA G37 N-methylase TrmD
MGGKAMLLMEDLKIPALQKVSKSEARSTILFILPQPDYLTVMDFTRPVQHEGW